MNNTEFDMLALEANLTAEEKELLVRTNSLHQKLRQRTKDKYARINPPYEDASSWQERADFWLGKDSDVTVYNSATLIGDVKIGPCSWIGPFCMIDGTGGLTIGKYCHFSTGSQVVTHDTAKWCLSGGVEPYEYSPVTIGDCCFIGTNAVIKRGVTIGEHCLVAAGAVVVKDVPAFSIVGGVPAKQIGTVVLKDGKVSLNFFPEKNK